jgi:hypothetical protein
LVLKDADHDLLPECEEDGDFDSQKFEEGGVRRQRFVEGVIEQN